jgi:DNA-binding response OmpR family regulator
VPIPPADDIDVIVPDLQLHGGSGFGNLRELRRLPVRPLVAVATGSDIVM